MALFRTLADLTRGDLPTAKTRLALTTGEVAHYSGNAEVWETVLLEKARALPNGRYVYDGQLLMAPLGSIVGTLKDRGELTITNRRVVFRGKRTTHDILLANVQGFGTHEHRFGLLSTRRLMLQLDEELVIVHIDSWKVVDATLSGAFRNAGLTPQHVEGLTGLR